MIKALRLPLFIFLSSCSSLAVNFTANNEYEISPRKQKRKIATLEKKLKKAESEQSKIENEVFFLREEMQKARLALIEREIKEYETKLSKLHADPIAYAEALQIDLSELFLKEREALHEIIDDGPSPSALDAQMVLDRILRMITDLNNDQKELF